MKKFYVFAAVAIAALASCTKSEVVYNQGQQEIGFRQFTGSMTKADGDPTNLSELVGGPQDMGVFAYIYNSNPYKLYFSNAKFVKPASGNDWGGDPKRYWPLQDQLDFVLYAPYQSTDDATNTPSYTPGTKTLKVTITDNNTTPQKDYLYGKKFYANTSKPTSPSKSVPVVLKHALSKVTINVGASEDGIFTVSSVLLKNTYQNGSYVVSYTSDTDNKSNVTPSGSPVDMEFVAPSTWQPTTTVTACTASKLVVPSDQTSIVITYTMKGSEAAAVLTASIDLSTGTTTPVWETGKHYTYNITLKADEILFSPTVEDWTPVSESSQTQTIG